MTMETAAIYCRLSQDDGSVGESGSIQTQKTLLTQYCKEHHIKMHDMLSSAYFHRVHRFSFFSVSIFDYILHSKEHGLRMLHNPFP